MKVVLLVFAYLFVGSFLLHVGMALAPKFRKEVMDDPEFKWLAITMIVLFWPLGVLGFLISRIFLFVGRLFDKESVE